MAIVPMRKKHAEEAVVSTLARLERAEQRLQELHEEDKQVGQAYWELSNAEERPLQSDIDNLHREARTLKREMREAEAEHQAAHDAHMKWVEQTQGPKVLAAAREAYEALEVAEAKQRVLEQIDEETIALRGRPYNLVFDALRKPGIYDDRPAAQWWRGVQIYLNGKNGSGYHG
jgi:hypothetical protein